MAHVDREVFGSGLAEASPGGRDELVWEVGEEVPPGEGDGVVCEVGAVFVVVASPEVDGDQTWEGGVYGGVDVRGGGEGGPPRVCGWEEFVDVSCDGVEDE